MSPGTPPIEWTEEKTAVASHLGAVGAVEGDDCEHESEGA